MVPPPPPGPPPGSQQSWGRQVLTPGENESLVSATYIPGGQSVSHGIDLSKAPGHRHNVSDASLGGLSPSEADDQWPLSRVLVWPRKNGFSKDWQETFKSLEFQGADFLELGLPFGGRGRLSKMHSVVYPELAKECARSGTDWDSTHEREEGRRMRKLIRQINDGLQDASFSTPMRETPVPVSAEDGIVLFSCPSPEPRSASPIDIRFHPSPHQVRKDSLGEIGIRRKGIVDFDCPRYEKDEAETPVPYRKPPAATNEPEMLGTRRPETIEYVSGNYQELRISRGSSGGKLAAETGECGHGTEQKAHPDPPLAMKTSLMPSGSFEELLLRWTKLGRNEIQALGDPIS